MFTLIVTILAVALVRESYSFELSNNGTKQTHMMFTEPGVRVDVNIGVSISKCQLRMLAVGGGGEGLNCGGGSGYIQYVKQAEYST